jgi:ankyrin repeat protein
MEDAVMIFRFNKCLLLLLFVLSVNWLHSSSCFVIKEKGLTDSCRMALRSSIINGDLEGVKDTIESTPDIIALEGMALIRYSATVGEGDIVELLLTKMVPLLEGKLDIDDHDLFGNSALICAFKYHRKTIPVDSDACERVEVRKKKRLRVIQLLLAHGANMHAQNRKGRSPLYYALKSHCFEWIDPFIGAAKGNDAKNMIINALAHGMVETAEWTPVFYQLLHQALQKDCKHLFLFILEYAATVDRVLQSKESLLQQACFYGSSEICLLLLKMNVSRAGSCENADLLDIAALQGHVSVVDLLIDSGFDVNSAPKGSPPLHVAAEKGYLDLLERLIEKGALIDLPDTILGATSLHCAALKGHLKVVKKLIDYQAKIDVQDAHKRTALCSAAEIGFLDIVELLIKSGASRTIVDAEDRTPLICATRKGHLAIVKLLLAQEKSDKDLVLLREEKESYPLHIAAGKGYEEVVDFLLRQGISIDQQTKDNRITALHMAAMKGRDTIVAKLLGANANVKVDCAHYRMTPLHFAADKGHVEVVKMLLGAKGMEVDSGAAYERTPLYWASCSGHENVVAELIKRGANLRHCENHKKQTALHIAVIERHENVVRVLLAKGADNALKDSEGKFASDYAQDDNIKKMFFK